MSNPDQLESLKKSICQVLVASLGLQELAARLAELAATDHMLSPEAFDAMRRDIRDGLKRSQIDGVIAEAREEILARAMGDFDKYVDEIAVRFRRARLQ